MRSLCASLLPQRLSISSTVDKGNRKVVRLAAWSVIPSRPGISSSLEAVVAVRWIAPVLNISVSILAGITAFFKFHDRYYNLQQSADAIEQENTAFDLAIRQY